MYAAQHPRLPRMVALKVLNVPSADPEFRLRFQREGQPPPHWNIRIVPIYDCGEDQASSG